MEKTRRTREDSVIPPKMFRREMRTRKNGLTPKRNDGKFVNSKSGSFFGIKEVLNPARLQSSKRLKLKGWMRENKKYRRYKKAA